jgi:hypothetical protein
MDSRIAKDWLLALEEQRKALGMTYGYISKRSSVPLLTVRRILARQNVGAQFDNVLAVATVLGARTIGTIPQPDEVAEKEIRRQAKRVVRLVQGTMALEAQGITDAEYLKQLEETAAKEIRQKPRKHLWARPCRTSRQSQAKRRSTTSPG